MAFQHTWSALQKSLYRHQSLQTRSAKKPGGLGRYFSIVSAHNSFIEVEPCNKGKNKKAKYNDFKIIYNRWSSYKNQQTQRQTLRNLSRHSTYIISIYYWLEPQLGRSLP